MEHPEGLPDLRGLRGGGDARGGILPNPVREVLHRFPPQQQLGVRLQVRRRLGQQDVPPGKADARPRGSQGQVRPKKGGNEPEVRQKLIHNHPVFGYEQMLFNQKYDLTPFSP